MNSIDLIEKIYKPYKITVKNSIRILNCNNADYVIKKKNNRDIKELYKYLSSRGFDYYPRLIEDNRSEINVYEYINDSSIDDEQKLMDLINIVSLLHNKTSYYKEISNDKIKEIYERLLGRVYYIEESLNKVISEIEDDVFVSPSGSLLLNNSSKVFESLTFVKKEIEYWYKLSIDSNKMRVCLVHNNLELDHYIKGDKDYLISWDNYIIDSPIIDIVNLYKKIYINYDFTEALNLYLEKFKLKDNEKKLLFIMLIIPNEIELSEDEINNVNVVRHYLDYIFKTENLIKNIYNKKNE